MPTQFQLSPIRLPSKGSTITVQPQPGRPALPPTATLTTAPLPGVTATVTVPPTTVPGTWGTAATAPSVAAASVSTVTTAATTSEPVATQPTVEVVAPQADAMVSVPVAVPVKRRWPWVVGALAGVVAAVGGVVLARRA